MTIVSFRVLMTNGRYSHTVFYNFSITVCLVKCDNLLARCGILLLLYDFPSDRCCGPSKSPGKHYGMNELCWLVFVLLLLLMLFLSSLLSLSVICYVVIIQNSSFYLSPLFWYVCILCWCPCVPCWIWQFIGSISVFT